jgi:membrane-bound ClpP family serine protease
MSITSVGFDRVRTLQLGFISFALLLWVWSYDLVVIRCFWVLDILGLWGLSVRFCGVFMVIRLMRIASVTWIISVIQAFKFIALVSVIKAKRVIFTLNEYAKASRSVRCQMSCKDCAHLVGRYCTHFGRLVRSHGLCRGARRREGYPGHPGRKLCSLIRLSCYTDFVLLRELR